LRVVSQALVTVAKPPRRSPIDKVSNRYSTITLRTTLLFASPLAGEGLGVRGQPQTSTAFVDKTSQRLSSRTTTFSFAFVLNGGSCRMNGPRIFCVQYSPTGLTRPSRPTPLPRGERGAGTLRVVIQALVTVAKPPRRSPIDKVSNRYSTITLRTTLLFASPLAGEGLGVRGSHKTPRRLSTKRHRAFHREQQLFYSRLS
jgi:hypothetical protein